MRTIRRNDMNIVFDRAKVSRTEILTFRFFFAALFHSTPPSQAQLPTPAPRMGGWGLPDHAPTLSDNTTQIAADWWTSKLDQSCREGFSMLALSERARAAGNREGAIDFIERAYRSFDDMRMEKGAHQRIKLG